MRLDVALPMDDWRAVEGAAREAEAAGYDGLRTPEQAHDPFLPLVLAALATERIELTTGIAVVFPRSPTVVASIAWDLHTQSGGRFHLGLGTQVKGHNERRFGVPWSPPVPRLREYMGALRAIWRCWELGEPLRFEGEHYNLSLMTPEFSQKPAKLAPIPISIAAVGPGMLKLAGEACDGVRLLPFATRKYLERVVVPSIEKGLQASGRSRSAFEVRGGGFAATGANADELRKRVETVRYRLSFYGSTRTYHGVFAQHGWEEVGERLHAMSKKGQWKEMPGQITDELLHTFAAIGTHDEIADRIKERFGGICDNVSLTFGANTDPGVVREVLQDVKRIPAAFQGFAKDW